MDPSVQLMRKCLPKTPLPLTSDQSAYTFPLPGRPNAAPDMDVEPGTVLVFNSCHNSAEEPFIAFSLQTVDLENMYDNVI